MDSADTEWKKIGPTQARSAARAYAALGARSRAQKASMAASATYTLTALAIAGMVVRRGPITAVIGTESDYRRVARFRAPLGMAAGIVTVTLVNIAVPGPHRFGVLLAFVLVMLGLMAAILPAYSFHRSRGIDALHDAGRQARKWKESHGARHIWLLRALIHDPEITAGELEASMRSLVPEISPGWAAVVFAATDVQVQALQRLGFSRDGENSGLMYRTVDESRVSIRELPTPGQDTA